MSYNTEIQSNNEELLEILNELNALPEAVTDAVLYSPQTLSASEQAQARANIGITDIQRFTALPSSGSVLTANAEYRVSSNVGTYQFNFPESGDVYVRFKTGSTFSISFTSGTTYLGAVPKFEGGKTYELMARDKCVAVAEVVSA